MLKNLKKLKRWLDLVAEGRVVVTKEGRVFLPTGKELGKKKGKDAYRKAHFWISEERRTIIIGVHVLVWITFKGLIEDPTKIVHHKNHDKEDCRLRNLELVTQSINIKKAFEAGIFVPSNGEDQHLAVLTNDKVHQIRRLFSSGKYTSVGIAEKFGLSKDTACNVLSGRTYKNVSLEFLPQCQSLLSLRGSKVINIESYGNLVGVAYKLRKKNLSWEEICTKLVVGKSLFRQLVNSRLIDAGGYRA